MKVLLCVDDDLRYEDVLSSLSWCLPLGEGDEVLVTHVVASLRWMPLRSGNEPGWAGTERAIFERVDDFLSETAAKIRELGIGADVLRLEGDIGGQILSAADEADVDLIVLGALGQARSQDFLVGSVAEKLETIAHRDVLLVRPRRSPQGSRFTALLAVDASEASRSAVRTFATKTRAEGASIRVVHVLESMPSTWNVDIGDGESEGAPSVMAHKADDAVDGAKAILRSFELDAEVDLRRGSPAAEILAAAAACSADLIVVGSRRGSSGEAEAWSGTVAKRVARHATGSVLIAAHRALEGV
jgi:nucleotide-binding universal stress UspA family protein